LIISGILFGKFLTEFIAKADDYGLTDTFSQREEKTISLFCRVIRALSNIELSDLNVLTRGMILDEISQKMKDISLILMVFLSLILSN
jgi:hypothetical protein